MYNSRFNVWLLQCRLYSKHDFLHYCCCNPVPAVLHSTTDYMNRSCYFGKTTAPPSNRLHKTKWLLIDHDAWSGAPSLPPNSNATCLVSRSNFSTSLRRWCSELLNYSRTRLGVFYQWTSPPLSITENLYFPIGSRTSLIRTWIILTIDPEVPLESSKLCLRD